MMQFDSHILYIPLALVLLFAVIRLAQLLCRCFSIPAVIGELVAGILLGPSLLGTLWPEFSHILFPVSGIGKTVFRQVDSIAVLLLLFTAGLEMETAFIKSHVKQVVFTSIASAVFPFLAGLAVLAVLPALVQAYPGYPIVLPVFFGIAMGISALPVVIRILGDLGLIDTKIGSITIASALVMDFVGWAAFTGLLGVIGSQSENAGLPLPIRLLLLIVGLVTGFIVLPKVLDPLFGRLREAKNGFVFSIAVALAVCLSGAAFTESMGVHTGFGALMAGVLIGNLPSLPEKAKSFLFGASRLLAPIFFVNIGGHLNFSEHFDLSLLVIILLASIPAKIVGSCIGGLVGGLKAFEALTVGVLLNARGAMEIILAKQALESGLIDDRLFVALALMALVTSLLSSYGAKFLISLRPAREESLCITT